MIVVNRIDSTRYTIEWYEAVSGWKEFSLGSIDDDKEEIVFVPGSCSPCLMQLLMSLCEYLDNAGCISDDVRMHLLSNT